HEASVLQARVGFLGGRGSWRDPPKPSCWRLRIRTFSVAPLWGANPHLIDVESLFSVGSVGCRLPLQLADLDALEVRVVSMSFRGAPLKKMGKRGASGVVQLGENVLTKGSMSPLAVRNGYLRSTTMSARETCLMLSELQ